MGSQGVRTTTSSLDFGSAMAGEVLDVAYDQYGTRACVMTEHEIGVFDNRSSDEWNLVARWSATEAGRQGVGQRGEGGEGGKRSYHGGVLTKVAWAHAEFGQVIASASSDGFACVWAEVAHHHQQEEGGEEEGSKLGGGGGSQWNLAASFKCSRTRCLDMKFSPPQYGLRVGLSFEDGHLKLYRCEDTVNATDWQLVQDVLVGSFSSPASGGEENSGPQGGLESCNAFCWRPFSQDMPEMLLVGTSRQASIWSFESSLGRWNKIVKLPCEAGRVSDVSWASACGKTSELVAYSSGSTVYVTQLKDNLDRLDVNTVAKCEHGDGGAEVFQVEWNKLGTTLATSSSDGRVRLWRPDLMDEWHEMTRIVGTSS
ncbi:nucleoporin [Chloropicon primus]|uniref:Nucleoporin n=2 Tax=Chloropicon primus TaxID=1764295 RepID=A0A5B8MXR5_9CHLO|nr:nucleoporin [Chloropicon primus]UPR03487.1 nucleoporin [Chloropicon primus]|eukprot:QDZ24280.1 nucleoporin [Chloropicon primus]